MEDELHSHFQPAKKWGEIAIRTERDAANRYIHLFPPPFCVSGELGECRFVSALLLISCRDGCDFMLLLAAWYGLYRGPVVLCSQRLYSRVAGDLACALYGTSYTSFRFEIMRRLLYFPFMLSVGRWRVRWQWIYMSRFFQSDV